MAFVTFGEPHGGGHYLWHVGDTEYPAHPSGDLSGAPDPLRRVYEAVDEAIGMILEVVDDDTTVLVTSGDGMGPNYSAAHHMPELLRRLGLSHAGDGAVEDGPRGPRRSSGGGVMSTIRNAIPLSLRHAVTRCLPHSLHYRLNLKWINAGIDWQHSRMFCIPNSNEGYFRVNLAGREPTGTVTSETEYDELLAELCDHISKLVHPSTGQRAAHSILSMDRTYQGSERRHLPDLVATWDPEARILDELQTDAYGVIRQRPGYETVPYYTGNHRPASFVLGRGPRVAQGRTIADASIVDIAPTVLASLAVDPPAHFEGDAWKEILGG
jgi:predicted AlkP superfamily phosphohydrolase/phosphomutase